MDITKLPVGTIIPWNKSLTDVPQRILKYWKECDGSEITEPDSILKGTNAPDLNSTNTFLRGDSTSGLTGGSNTHTHYISDGSGFRLFVSGSAGAGEWEGYSSESDNLPEYFDVVYLIKIK